MKTDMNKKQKNTRTFLIKIMDQQNGTWQGSVTWVEEQREQHFRSALELLTEHLITIMKSELRNRRRTP